VDGDTVLGYVIGTTSTAAMKRVFGFRVLPRTVLKAALRGVFLRRTNLRFALHTALGLLDGEFSTSRFSSAYPATLHVNVDAESRYRNVGSRLLQHYIRFLEEEEIAGVHVSTMSERARRFFEKHGFGVLAEGRRSFLRYCLGSDLPLFILGRKL
jgi:ribosomal protein S18 acetylase RimI-like enzyme